MPLVFAFALNAIRIFGGNGYSTEFDVERYFRDAPLMIVGEGTNEIQRNVIGERVLGLLHLPQRRCGAEAAGEAMAARRLEDERFAYFAEASIVYLDLPDAVFRGYEGDEQLLGDPRPDDPAPFERLRAEGAIHSWAPAHQAGRAPRLGGCPTR